MVMLENKKPEIVKLCREYRIKELYVFGSSADGEFGTQSDIDLAVVFNRAGVSGSFDQYFDFKLAMESLLGRPVDLVCTNSIRNRHFQQELDATKKLIYAA